MLRVGLTGDLGSGKSTVAQLLAELGAVVLSSDEMARRRMEPGESLHRALVERFGEGVLDGAGRLDRKALARLAFDPAAPRVEEFNAIVHPIVLAEQEQRIQEIGAGNPHAIVVVESALIFSARVREEPKPVPSQADAQALQEEGVPWRSRFDCVVVVTAPRAVKIARYVSRAAGVSEVAAPERAALEAEAARRLDLQAKTPIPREDAVLLLGNDEGLPELKPKVAALWLELRRRAG